MLAKFDSIMDGYWIGKGIVDFCCFLNNARAVYFLNGYFATVCSMPRWMCDDYEVDILEGYMLHCFFLHLLWSCVLPEWRFNWLNILRDTADILHCIFYQLLVQNLGALRFFSVEERHDLVNKECLSISHSQHELFAWQ